MAKYIIQNVGGQPIGVPLDDRNYRRAAIVSGGKISVDLDHVPAALKSLEREGRVRVSRVLGKRGATDEPPKVSKPRLKPSTSPEFKPKTPTTDSDE